MALIEMIENGSDLLTMQKRLRFLMILEWEQNRSCKSSEHKDLLNALNARIMQKISISKEAVLAVVKFFREKSVGLLYYSEFLKNETEFLPEPPESIVDSSLIYGLSMVNQYQLHLSEIFKNCTGKIE